jgi:hypothetical protein
MSGGNGGEGLRQGRKRRIMDVFVSGAKMRARTAADAQCGYF